MEPINAGDLNKTVKRIQRILNIRYERKHELFVSRQETIEIKELISKGNIKALLNMGSVISREAIANVFLRNLWLVGTVDPQAKGMYLELLKNASFPLIEETVEELGDFRIQASADIRALILESFYETAPIPELLKALDEEKIINEHILKKVFSRIIKESDNKLLLIGRYCRKYPPIANDRNLLIPILNNMSEDDKENFFVALSGKIEKLIISGDEISLLFRGLFFEDPRCFQKMMDILSQYLQKKPAKNLCLLIQSYISKLTDPNEIQQRFEEIVGLLETCNSQVREKIKEKVFNFQGYKTETKQILIKVINEKDPNLLSSINISPTSQKFDTAEDVFEFLEKNYDRSTGDQKFAYLEYACARFIPKENLKMVIFELMDDYLNIDQNKVMDFILMFIIQKNQQKASGYILDFLKNKHEKNEFSMFWEKTEDNIINEFKKRFIKTDNLHDYLYQYKRDVCISYFGI